MRRGPRQPSAAARPIAAILRGSSFGLERSRGANRSTGEQAFPVLLGSRSLRIPFSIRPAGTAPFDVVGFGLNSIDLVGVVREFPEGNAKQRLRQFAQLPGGQIATAMVVCERLGWKARYLGRFGDDAFGRAARESLEKEGVNLEGARSIPGATNQFAIVLVDER